MAESIARDLFGQVAAFEVLTSSGVEHRLSERNRRLLAGATNFFALEAPGAEQRVEVYLAPQHFAPRLTDISTLRPPKYGTRIGTWTVRSTAAGAHGKTAARPRFVLLADDGPIPEAGSLVPPMSRYWRLRTGVEKRFPMLYDQVREILISRRSRNLWTYAIPRAQPALDSTRPVAPAPPEGARRAVLLGLHWLEIGGAERWAIETVKLVREAGMLPIVLTTRESYHPWITRPELDGALVVPLTHPTVAEDEEENHDERLLAGILASFDVAGVYVHHAQWLYDRLPWIRRSRPGLPIADTLHILEYNGGGYPASSAHLDDFVDLHHVISPQLERWFTEVQSVPAKKLVMAPLVELTSAQAATGSFKPRAAGADFTIGFVGRLVRQKRPYLYVDLLRKLRSHPTVRVRAILQGGGELEGVTRRQLSRHGMSDVEVRGHDFPVATTLAELDCLVIPSQNEGLTLTTLEAIANGVPVLSTDVGSQSTLITAPLLVPRKPTRFVEEAASAIHALAASEELRERLWREQFDRATEFSRAQSANSWAKGLFSSWRE